MANQRGSQNTISVESVRGSTIVKISGQSIHSNRDAQACADILAEILFNLDYKGEYKVVASMQRLKGSGRLQGLSITGLSINAIQFGYQPNGNDTRATYTLQHSCADEAQKCFVVMKAYVGTAYKKEPVLKEKAPSVQKPEEPNVSMEKTPAVSVLVTKPTSEPMVYYTKDPDWMLDTVLHLSDIADENPEHQVTKDQVLDLIVARTHLKNRAGTAPIYGVLFNKGHLLPVEGMVDTFTVVETPPVGFKGKRPWDKKCGNRKPVKSTLKVAVKNQQQKRQRYLSDEEWMRSFVSGLRAFVKKSKGSISKRDLLQFIGDRLVDNKSAGTVYGILEGLVRRNHVVINGTEGYRVAYEPPADIVEKAVAGIERARAEVGKVFKGLAPYRLPNFAEGLFENKELLDRLLDRLAQGETSTAMTLKAIAVDYPGRSNASYSTVVGYLCGKGYLIKSRHGWYMLGPEGRKRLGLPLPKAMLPVSTEAQPARLSASLIKRPQVPAPVATKSSAQGALPVSTEVPSQAILAGLAKLATEGRTLTVSISEARDRIAEKQARKAAALTAIAQRPDIDALVTQRLLSEIDQL